MYEKGNLYYKNNMKVSIEEISYVPLSEILEEELLVDERVIDDCKFSVSDDAYKFTVEAYHIQDDHDMYCVSVYDTTDDNSCDTFNRVCTSYYDSCGGCEASEGIRIHDIKGNKREDFEDVILDILFGTNGLIIAF